MLKRLGQKNLELVTCDKHIEDMGKLADKYATETGTAELVYDYEIASKAVRNGLEQGNFVGVLAYIDNEPVGMISCWLSYTYFTKPVAHGDMLYVVPEHRKSPLGRILVTLLEQAVRPEVSSLYVSTAGNMPTDKSLNNMYRRLNYEPVGTFFKKVF